MKRHIPTFHGRVGLAGDLVLLPAEDRQRTAYLRGLAGQPVDLRVTIHKDERSARANAYYWACVLEVMASDGSDGDQSAEEIHDAMCAMFLPDEGKRVEFFNRLTGATLEIDISDGRRSSKLTGEAFYVFVEQVRKFALEFMGIRTEDPDPEYWRKPVRKAAA